MKFSTASPRIRHMLITKNGKHIDRAARDWPIIPDPGGSNSSCNIGAGGGKGG